MPGEGLVASKWAWKTPRAARETAEILGEAGRGCCGAGAVERASSRPRWQR